MQEYFLMNISNSKLDDLKLEAKESLEKLFKRDMNDELKNLWFGIQLKMKNRKVFDDLNIFLSSTGRMKFLKNLYGLYSKLDAITARKTFNHFKYLYLSEVVEQIEKVLQ